ncbi:MAG TPA: hypothetical protein VF162_12445 [Streptosporangiaceae bacterium]
MVVTHAWPADDGEAPVSAGDGEEPVSAGDGEELVAAGVGELASLDDGEVHAVTVHPASRAATATAGARTAFIRPRP